MTDPQEQLATPIAALHSPALPAETRHGNPFFFGRFGLRAGYGIVLVVLVWGLLLSIGQVFAFQAVGVWPAIAAAQAYAYHHPGAHRPHVEIPMVPMLTIVTDGIVFVGLLGVCWLFSRAERRPLRAYGLGTYRFADILPGAFWGVAAMSAVVATLRVLHLLVFDHRELFGAAAFTYGFKWLFAFLLVGLAEEYFFRGYIQYAFLRGFWGLAEHLSITHTRAVAFFLASLATSLLFGITHHGNQGENAFGLVQVSFAGLLFAYALWRTGSVWWGVGFHMTWDWAQSFLFGVADSGSVSVGRLFATHPQGHPLLSGGTAGPEGSIFATVAFLLTLLIIRFTTRPGIQPALEPEPRVQDGAASVLHNSVA